MPGQMKLYTAPCDLFVVMQQFAWQRACTERARRRHRAHILPRVTTQTGSGASQGRASCELFEAQYNAYREGQKRSKTRGYSTVAILKRDEERLWSLVTIVFTAQPPRHCSAIARCHVVPLICTAPAQPPARQGINTCPAHEA